MADIAKIKLPDGVTYDIKDATARAEIAALNNWDYVISVSAATTPYGVVWTTGGGQVITGTLAASADTKYKIYLVPAHIGETGNIYDEYITVGSTEALPQHPYSWEKFGTTDVDLNGYAMLGDSVTVSGTAENHTTGITAKIPSNRFSLMYGVGDSIYDRTASYAAGVNSTAPTLGTPFTIPNVTARGSGSFTQGTFNAGTLPSATYTAETELLTLTVGTLPSHGADSHTHTAPTLGTAFTVPNITDVGSASTWTFSNVSVPTRSTGRYVLSVSNSSTDVSVTVTDSGHTHSVSATGIINESQSRPV